MQIAEHDLFRSTLVLRINHALHALDLKAIHASVSSRIIIHLSCCCIRELAGRLKFATTAVVDA